MTEVILAKILLTDFVVLICLMIGLQKVDVDNLSTFWTVILGLPAFLAVVTLPIAAVWLIWII